MKTLKFLTCLWVALIVLAACEQEETLQRSPAASPDLRTDTQTKSSDPSRDFTVVNLKSVDLNRNGYQRLKQNPATKSVLYANVREGKVAGYLIRQRNGRKTTYVPPGQDGGCPNLYVCIHPQTGQYIFYDKCVTDDPCGRPICPDLWWCIHPETGDYLLYDACQTDDPCQTGTPPMIKVSKKHQVDTFCPLMEYTWMIDPETGEYMLMQSCSDTQQLFLAVDW